VKALPSLHLTKRAPASPSRSEKLAQHGRETAQHYSYAAFRRAWIGALSRMLAIEPAA